MGVWLVEGTIKSRPSQKNKRDNDWSWSGQAEAAWEGESCLKLCSMLLIKSRLALRVRSMQGEGRQRHWAVRNINKLLPGFVMENEMRVAS